MLLNYSGKEEVGGNLIQFRLWLGEGCPATIYPKDETRADLVSLLE